MIYETFNPPVDPEWKANEPDASRFYTSPWLLLLAVPVCWLVFYALAWALLVAKG